MTINQKIRLKKNKTIKKNKNKEILLGQPQIKGLTLKVFTMTPKKPNSALRKVAKIKLNKGIGPKKQTIITAYIPGEKHTLSIHNLVLIRPGRKKDLPGIKYKIIRGVLDCK
jgi:small subunit ribosomal protein S12